MGKMIEIEADKKLDAYEAMPANTPKGAVIVVHEVWGLVDHVKSVADRFAAAGFMALAPNLLDLSEFNSGEIAQLQKDLFDPERRNQVQPQLRKLMAPLQEPGFGKLTTDRLLACFNYLYDQPAAQQTVAIAGFCFGGTYSFALAAAEPRLKLALPFYGHSDQSVDELHKINCPVRAFYGQNDERLIENLPELEQRMEDAKVDFQAKIYPDCGHAFFNDANSFAYNKAAADDAWREVQRELQRLV